MNYLAPGFRELHRILSRLFLRQRLWFEKRKLARLETALGLLGWQQADYDEQTQEHVNRLMDCERAQARLTNESAALALEIGELEKEQGTRCREFKEACAQALARGTPGARAETELGSQLAEKRKECREIEGRLAVLNRELTAAEKEYQAQAAQQSSPPARDELLRLRKLILALPCEKTDWQARLAHAELELSAMESVERALGEARRRFEEDDAAMTRKIADRQRAKSKVAKQTEAMERGKDDPYREIGRALADHDIAPMNQPDALQAVLRQRERIDADEATVAASLEASARENRSLLWQSWFLTGALLVTALLAVLAIASH